MDRSSFMRVVLSLGALALGFSLASCGSDQDALANEPRNLRFTSADPLILTEWWTNGHELLRLRDDGGYEIYPGTNRYEAPVERGTWAKRSYVALEFDAYAALNPHVERVQLDRDSEGGPVLILRDLWPFIPIDAPPLVLEDSLFGQWRTDGFILTLHRNMRYALRHAEEWGEDGAAVAGHEGLWSIRDGNELVLLPDAPGLEPIILALDGGEAITIDDADRVVPSR